MEEVSGVESSGPVQSVSTHIINRLQEPTAMMEFLLHAPVVKAKYVALKYNTKMSTYIALVTMLNSTAQTKAGKKIL